MKSSWRASPAHLEDALARNAKIQARIKSGGSEKDKKALKKNVERIRVLLDYILSKTFSGGKISCRTEANADRLRMIYIEAVKRGIVTPKTTHEIMDKASDSMLCLAVQAGHSLLSNDAVVALIDRHRGKINAFKKKHYGLSPDEIDIRCQEAVWRSARLFNPKHGSGAKFSTHLHHWLNRNSRARTKGDKGDRLLAREEGIAVISSTRKDQHGEASDLFDTIGAEQEEAVVKMDDKIVRRALKAVKGKQRAVLELRFYHNLSVEKASLELGMSVDEVVSSIEAGLETMRKKLALST